MLALVFLSLGLTANADLSTCVADVIVINENMELQMATEGLVTNYVETCEATGQCDYDVDESLLSSDLLAATPTEESLADIPPIEAAVVVSTDQYFTDPTYLEYEKVCKSNMGSIECADVALLLQGVLSFLDDTMVDVDVKGNALPLCLPPSCDGEDLTVVVEEVAKIVIKNDPDVADALLSAGIPSVSAIDMFNVELLCGLSGLETCSFEALPTSCPVGGIEAPVESSSASNGSAGPVFASLAAVVGALAAI